MDYKYAGFNHWGYKAGCEFAEQPTKAVKATTDANVQRYTCQIDELHPDATECTVDLTSRGVCTADSSFDGLLHVQVQCSHSMGYLPCSCLQLVHDVQGWYAKFGTELSPAGCSAGEVTATIVRAKRFGDFR